ncbi:hypothetical protein E4U60_007127 [Claviceps pazoutovae]|uniref:Mediator of RNA polymerase II transcription subunit 17 n=1 Tax=Claviceps pazoutovae TaxID=1649127 RepID=A0A9P7MGB1_9HYPO|nr:hypothetical protein E4U60_007127 [Claviceps pazoutovae]
MNSAESPPLSLRPFPVADRAPKNLAEFISRVNAQPGGFRDLTEEKLRDEIRSRDGLGLAPDSDPEDVDMSDAGNEEDQAKDPSLARNEVLKNIEIASNTAMLTLDSLSLLLSKQSPTQASLTLSQQLRDMVGIGTLGADRLDEPTAKPPQQPAEQEEVAMGLTLMQINQARDAADETGKFLQREVEVEGRYWRDIVAVKEAGWAICRMPKERHTLAVKFGFSEAAAEFKNNGLAPMNRGPDGSIDLDLGGLGDVSEGLVVAYEKNGKVVGRSVPRRRKAPNDGASLVSRVLEARNTIFSQELWHELMCEARTLAAYDVKLQGSTITFRVDDSSSIILELVALESHPTMDDESSSDKGSGSDNNTSNKNHYDESNIHMNNDSNDNDFHDNSTSNNINNTSNTSDTKYTAMAETISLSLHILLSYAHRYNELMRIRPVPPHISRTRGQQAYALLRPVIARIMSIRSIQECTEFIGNMTKALHNAGFRSSSFILKTPPYSVVDATTHSPNQPAGSQSLIRNMLLPIEANIIWTILPDTSLTIRCRTFIFPVTTTFYHIVLPASAELLRRHCAPFPDGYTDIEGLFDYICTTTSRVLALHFLSKLSHPISDPELDGGHMGDWMQIPHNSALRHAVDEKREIHFSVLDAPVTLYVSGTVPVKDHRNGDGGDSNGKEGECVEDGEKISGDDAACTWTWIAGQEGSESRTMEDVIAHCAGTMRSDVNGVV